MLDLFFCFRYCNKKNVKNNDGIRNGDSKGKCNMSIKLIQNTATASLFYCGARDGHDNCIFLEN